MSQKQDSFGKHQPYGRASEKVDRSGCSPWYYSNEDAAPNPVSVDANPELSKCSTASGLSLNALLLIISERRPIREVRIFIIH